MVIVTVFTSDVEELTPLLIALLAPLLAPLLTAVVAGVVGTGTAVVMRVVEPKHSEQGMVTVSVV